MTKNDFKFIGRLPDNEELPGRTILVMNMFTEDPPNKSLNFAVDISDEFTDMLKKTISVEAQAEMADKAGDVVRDVILKQLGLEPH